MVSERMNEQDLQVLLARSRGNIIDGNPYGNDEADPGPESKLQSKIKTHCKERGWPVLAFPQTKQVMTYLPQGWPDITIILPFGTVLFLELKAERGRLSPEQNIMRSMFHYLGHTIHEVRSWKRYTQITEGLLRRK